MSEYLLEVKDLKKYFDTPKGKLHAVDGVSFAIERGKTLGVVGESGCGKSTTGRTILRLLEPTSGTILFEGKDISKLNRREMRAMRKDMQIIFQDPFSSLDPKMPINKLISEPIVNAGLIKDKKELEKRVLELMETVGLSPRLYNSYPHELDGGRRQRVGIARALALDPKFIVCDEPVSALDVSIQAQIINLLMKIQQESGLTLMFISHDLSVVRHISTDIGVMYLGQMVEMAPKKELFAHMLHPYTKALISAVPSVDIHNPSKRIILKGELTSPIDPKPGCRFYTRCPYAEQQCKEPQQLKEVIPGHLCACCRAAELNSL